MYLKSPRRRREHFYCRKRYTKTNNNNNVSSGGRGGRFLLCRAVCKRLQKRRPKDQGFGNNNPTKQNPTTKTTSKHPLNNLPENLEHCMIHNLRPPQHSSKHDPNTPSKYLKHVSTISTKTPAKCPPNLPTHPRQKKNSKFGWGSESS